MKDNDPAPLRWPLAVVFATFIIAGLTGCYYYPAEYGYCPPSYGNSGYYPSSYHGGHDSHSYHKHAKYKQPKYKHAKYKHAKHRRPTYCPY